MLGRGQGRRAGQGRMEHGTEPRGIGLAKSNRAREGRFGLMFKNLPAFEPPDDLLKQLATKMEEAQSGNFDNPKIPSGFTFLGQFIDHDLTFDTTPLDEQQADPDATTNFRTALYDLDSVYEGAPTDSNGKLVIGNANDPNLPDDLPRDSNGTAQIGDPRNDENLIICQLHLAFLKFHNAMVDHVRAQGTAANRAFEEAQRLCRWYYQWVVLHDFLPRIIGQNMLDQLLEERPNQAAKVKLDFYKPGNPNRPMMPVEFAVAAYRFGHSLIRPGYQLNANSGGVFFGPQASNQNMNGFRPIPPGMVIEWHRFFNISGQQPPQPSHLLDSFLVTPLFNLPESVVPPTDDPAMRVGALAERNLLRGKRVGLPSGQQVAQAMGVTTLSNQDLGVGNESGWNNEAPLWFYILKEAELQHNGQHLGEVGGRIVGEVLLGLLVRDKNSYLHPSNQNPSNRRFTPASPIAPTSGQFAMGDLLKFAGVA